MLVTALCHRHSAVGVASTYQATPMSSAGIPLLFYGCAFDPRCNKQSLSLFQSPQVTNTPVKHTLAT